MQQGVHRRPLARGELSATICPETTRGPSSERRKIDQRAVLVPGHLQLQDSQDLNDQERVCDNSCFCQRDKTMRGP